MLKSYRPKEGTPGRSEGGAFSVARKTGARKGSVKGGDRTNERETAEEVLDFFTRVMRGDLGDGKVSERTKAAELLGKHCGLFDETEADEGRRSETAAEIERLLEGILPDG